MARRLWHVSSSLNRTSIAEHGLDWRKMMITTGIASSPGHGGPFAPELDVVFLCESLDDVEFFAGFGQHPLVDVWEVDARGLAIEPGPDGWVLTRTPIPPQRLQLMHVDRTPGSRELTTASLVFRSSRLTVEQMSALAGIAPDDAGYETGEPVDDLDASPPYSWWVIEGGDRYAPLRPQVEEVMARIAAAEAGLTRLAAAADEATFAARGRAREGALSPRSRALLGRIGVTVESP